MSIRALLDENMPHKLRLALSGFDTFMVRYLGYRGLRNGDLLKQSESAGFHVFLTGDNTMEYEQEMRGRRIAVISPSVPHWQFLQNHVEAIAQAVRDAKPGSGEDGLWRIQPSAPETAEPAFWMTVGHFCP